MSNLLVRSRYWLVLGGVLCLGLAAALCLVRPIRTRGRVAWWKATGSMPDLRWTDLLRMSRARGPIDFTKLTQTRNPYTAIRNPFRSAADISAGRYMFESRCTSCHGANGTAGPAGPALRRRQMVQGASDYAIFRTIALGIRGAMPGHNLPERDTWQLVAYVKSLMLDSEAAANTKPSLSINPDPVRYEEIRDAEQYPDRWLTYSGSYSGQRFSRDDQITAANVSGLRLLWMRQFSTPDPSIETSPLVVSGYMFVTAPPNRVEALDANTGTLIWAYDRVLPETLALCCGYVNRGLAVLGSALFLGTLDGHLVALDIRNGKVLWDVEIADYKSGYSITAAPLATKNIVITGVAGGEYGIRGFVDARDASTGNEIWRFDTIPSPGQAGSDSWEGNSWRTGGGPTWMTGSFDPERNLLYWPTGNPSPNYEGDVREGDNLYTNSVIALDAGQGTLKWHFQFTPHDIHDWDANQILVLLDETIAGQPQHLLAQADRNGFYYLLDRVMGKFYRAVPIAKQTWAAKIDEHGRPVLNTPSSPTEQGTALFPGVGGATTWQSPSYSPSTDLMYVSVLDWGGVFYGGHAEYRPGELFTGGSFQFFSSVPPQASVRALNASTGEVRWEYGHSATNIGGLLSTQGGVVFGSLGDIFFALDAKTGRELWHVGTGGRIVAAPITFLYHGKQLVTIAAGHDILTFGL